MKLLTLECPKCNAQLQVNSMLNQAVCNYCGFQFLIDDESRQVNINIDNPRQLGYEFARGESEQKVEEGRYYANKVGELIRPILDLNRFIGERNALMLQIEELRKKKNENNVIPAITAVGIFLLGAMLSTVNAWFMAGGIAAAAAFYYICYCYQRYQLMETERQIGQKTGLYNNICNSITYINNTYDVGFIPYEYRSETALKSLYQMLASQRAFNMQQAINLYEEEKHKAQMAALYQTQVNMQRRQIQALAVQNQQMAAQLQQIEGNTRNRDSSGMRKALAVGGMLMAAIVFGKKGD